MDFNGSSCQTGDVSPVCFSLKFCEIKDVSSLEFQGAMRIYCASFPENERHPIEIIRARVSSGKMHLITGMIEKDVVFMALLSPLKDTFFLIGYYLATDEEYRNLGIGRRFLRDLFTSRENPRFDHFLIEAENPYIDSDEAKLKRLKFYKKSGMKELKGVRYILPPLQGTKPSEMILMIYSPDDRDRLDGETIKDVIIRMYREFYSRYEGDEFLTLTLGTVPALSDYR